ncbi:MULTISPECIES: hypothetical protein [unclassified Rathayibacter]|uniref:hypothetical protein n=1 Tax=unclassified Rathayibacter TaxID=2609250 RepID=UPI000CE8F187|nr:MULTISPECIES: hypothetical protein [unclassified Rathayibacter]PPF26310.1 hypothetical protein C5C54_13780 [Rathayibacter sp. AY1F2]PPH42450.1 hypothetical protein C5C42_15335 [Rathayibacter sp. AY1F7]
MGNIPVSGGNQPAKHFTWKDGVKTVTTDNGSRIDRYSQGDGKPDGPNHVHEWETRSKNGKQTGGGIRWRDGH